MEEDKRENRERRSKEIDNLVNENLSQMGNDKISRRQKKYSKQEIERTNHCSKQRFIKRVE